MKKYTEFSLQNLRAQGYKTFFMLNSAESEHEILKLHNYENINNLVFFRLRKLQNEIFPAHKC